MDDQPLHDLLDGALAGEPPLGPVGQNSLTAGIRLRRRRRIRAAAATAAAAAVIAVAIPVGLGASGHLLRPEGPHRPPILYVYSQNGPGGAGTLTPISTATNTPGRPIHVGNSPFSNGMGQVAITPDGRTAYVITGNSVTPVSTATGTAGKPIKVVSRGVFHPDFIAITPDGKTVYVATSATYTVTPINTATNTPGKPIRVGWYPGWIAITPDGKTAYVRTWSGVTPISTANGTPGKPIRMHSGTGFAQVAITQDGKTAYATSGIPSGRRAGTATLIPINTATNARGKPIDVGKGESGGGIVFTPDGKTAYAVTVTPGECPGKCGIGTAMVTPVSTATGMAGRPIKAGSCRCLGTASDGVIAITPDGKTVYVLSGSTVTPISTATGTPGKPIHLGTVGSSMAISTATYTPSKPIRVLGRWPMTIVITP
jgi:DNA-binding beta-propeller fold protein YncE